MTSLVGRWDIVSWEQVYDDGRVQRPLGDRLTGFIDYSVDGRVTVMISKADRAPFVTGGQWDADDAEQAAAYRSVLAYAGRYELDGAELDGATVTHFVEISLFPGWVGGKQVRRVAERDGEIALEARLEEGTPQARTARLSWRRAEDGGTE